MKEPKLNIFVIRGGMGAGKDTLGEAIKNQWLKDAEKLSFATALKDELTDFLTKFRNKELNFENMSDVTEEEFKTLLHYFEQLPEDFDNFNTRHTLQRKILQWWGSEVRRAKDPDYWIKALKIPTEGNYYVTDARFANELEEFAKFRDLYCDKENTYVAIINLDVAESVRIERIKKRDGFAPSEESLNHPSELDHERFDNYDDVFTLTEEDPNTIEKMLYILKHNRKVRLESK